MDFRPMGIDAGGWAFGMDKLNSELDRHQFIRELTQNAIEAIQQTPDGTGNVYWELYPMEVGDGIVNKLCCIDDGVGMTGPEMVEYINTGFKSGKTQGHKGNYGIGAKVSALTFNKAGILYFSWKDGQGSMIHLSQDPETGVYGLNKLQAPDGTYGWWSPIGGLSPTGQKIKPKAIGRHGTMVVLLGDTEEQDTFEKPEGSDLPAAYWVSTYLRRKYFRFPEGVTVRAREQSTPSGKGVEGYREIRIVRPQSDILSKYSEQSGVVRFDGFSVAYWLLSDADKAATPALERPMSQVAALYRDELYEARYGHRGGYHRMANFGIPVGQRRIVLFVVPDEKRTSTNLTRQKLMLDGQQSLPWDRYAATFAENLPQPIKDMVEEIISKTDARTDLEKILERLRELKRLLAKVDRYRTDENGDLRADTPTPGGVEGRSDTEIEDDKPSGGEGGIKGHINRLIRSASGEKARKAKAKNKVPDILWVSRAADTREEGYLEDRAAVYHPVDNRITASKDFRTYVEIVEALRKVIPQSNGLAESAAELEIGMILTETVLNLLRMEGSVHWTSEEVKNQYSPEAMTNAVNHTFHIVKAAEKEMRERVRKSREQEKAS